MDSPPQALRGNAPSVDAAAAFGAESVRCQHRLGHRQVYVCHEGLLDYLFRVRQLPCIVPLPVHPRLSPLSPPGRDPTTSLVAQIS